MCSMPIDWKAVIGNQQARILPGTLLLTSAMVTPRQTSQLAITPRTNARKKPSSWRSSYFLTTFALLRAMIFAATCCHIPPPSAAEAGSTVQPLVRLMAINRATTAVPIQLPSHTQAQLRNVAPQVLLPAH